MGFAEMVKYGLAKKIAEDFAAAKEAFALSKYGAAKVKRAKGLAAIITDRHYYGIERVGVDWALFLK